MTCQKIVLDSETENVAPKPLMSASPHWERNYIVALGLYFISDSLGAVGEYSEEYMPHGAPCDNSKFKTALMDNPVLIGQNIKFDLLFLLRDYVTYVEILDWYKRGGIIWDTMLAEYLLSAQSHMFPSMDDMAKQYGLPLKDSKIKEYWEDGVSTSEIPKDELMPYLKHDVYTTYGIYLRQIEQVRELGMERFVMAQMEALLATTIMEQNGMHFDGTLAKELGIELEGVLESLTSKIVETLKHLTTTRKLPIEWNPASPVQFAKVFYGGSIKYTEKVEVKALDGSTSRYKSGAKKGEIRYKNEEKHILLTQPVWVDYWADKTKLSHRGTGEDVLKSMKHYLKEYNPPNTESWKNLLEDLLEFRKIHKELNTYIKGYSEYASVCNGRIHPNFNHTATATGRLSCSKPNLQNVTRGE